MKKRDLLNRMRNATRNIKASQTKFKFYVVCAKAKKIVSGHQDRMKAMEAAVDLGKRGGKPKVMSKPRVGSEELDPNNPDNWLDSTMSAVVSARSVERGRENETRTYTVTGSGEALDQLERLMVAAHTLGAWGSTRRLVMPFDGDGADKLDIAELENHTFDRDTFDEVIRDHHEVDLTKLPFLRKAELEGDAQFVTRQQLKEEAEKVGPGRFFTRQEIREVGQAALSAKKGKKMPEEVEELLEAMKTISGNNGQAIGALRKNNGSYFMKMEPTKRQKFLEKAKAAAKFIKSLKKASGAKGFGKVAASNVGNILHVQVGSENNPPTPEQLDEIVAAFMEADDTLSIIATPHDVEISELSNEHVALASGDGGVKMSASASDSGVLDSLYFHVGNSGITFSVADEGLGPEFRIKSSAFGNMDETMRVMTTERSLWALASMVARVLAKKTGKFSEDYVHAAKVGAADLQRLGFEEPDDDS